MAAERNEPNHNPFSKLKQNIDRLVKENIGATLDQICTELNQHVSDGAVTISSTKQVQWKITYYALLMDAALAGSLTLFQQVCSQLQRIHAGASSIAIMIMSVAATVMLCKTERDLTYYRVHIRKYEILRSRITGILNQVEQHVGQAHPKLRRKANRSISARISRIVFTAWFFVALWLGALFGIWILVAVSF